MTSRALKVVNFLLNPDVFFPRCLEIFRHFLNYDTSFVTKEIYNDMVKRWKDRIPPQEIPLLERYICLFFCYYDDVYAIPEQEAQSLRKNQLIYVKRVKLGKNMYKYMSDKGLGSRELSIVYCFGDFPKYLEFTKAVGIPIIHSGTLNFYETVPYNKQNSNYHTLLDKFKKIIGQKIKDSFLTLVFGSMSLANYGFYSENDERPRDIDFWYLSEQDESLQPKIHEIEKRDKSIDGYGLTVTKKEEKVSMTERYFNFFQSMANAGYQTRYITNKILEPPLNILPLQKIQTNNVAGEGPFLVIRPEDLLFDPDNHIYVNGCKFLVLELEIFRKHMRALDVDCKIKNQEVKCKGFVVDKDVGDFQKLNSMITKGYIKPRKGFDVTSYSRFLAVDADVNVRIHDFAIYTSVPTEQAYKLENVPIIRSLSNSKRTTIANIIRIGFINKVLPESVVPKNHVYRRSIVSKMFKYGNAFVPIETFTRIGDPLSEVLYTHQKVYRNVSLGTLPHTPIKSIYGNLPSCWLWILTDKGSIDVILVTSGLELIAKHLALAANTNMDIIAAGELFIQSNGDLVFNTNSGTYVNKKVILNTDIEDRFLYLTKGIIFLNFREKSQRSIYHTTEALIPDNKSPLLGELELLCSGYELEDRVYQLSPESRFTFTQQEFDDIKAKGKEICKFRKTLKSKAVKAKDFDTTNLEPVIISEERFKNLLKISDFGISDSLKLVKAIQKGNQFVNKCNLKDGYKDYTILSKNSASSSITILAQVKLVDPLPNYVALKIYPSSSNLNIENSLELEEQIYSKIPELLSMYMTPGLAMYVTSFTCGRDFFSAREAKFYDDTILGARNYDQYRTDVTTLNILMTEWTLGMSVTDYISSHIDELDEDFLKSIIFQVVYTVTVLNRTGLQQNDLHTGNVWITKLPFPTYFSYFLSNYEYFAVPCTHVCRIFDFDLAIVKDVRNARLSRIGLIETLNESNDVFRFLCSMNYLLKGHKIRFTFYNILSKFMDVTRLDYEKMCRPSDFRFMGNNLLILTTLWPLRKLYEGFDMNYLQRGQQDFEAWFQNRLPFSVNYIGRMFAFSMGDYSNSQILKTRQTLLINEISNNFARYLAGSKPLPSAYTFPPLKL